MPGNVKRLTINPRASILQGLAEARHRRRHTAKLATITVASHGTLLLKINMVAMCVYWHHSRESHGESLMDITIGIVLRNLRNTIVQRAPLRPARKTNLGIIKVVRPERRHLYSQKKKNHLLKVLQRGREDEAIVEIVYGQR